MFTYDFEKIKKHAVQQDRGNCNQSEEPDGAVAADHLRMHMIDIDACEDDDCKAEENIFQNHAVGTRLRLGFPELFVIGFQNHEVLVRDNAFLLEDRLSLVYLEHDGAHHVCHFLFFRFREILIVGKIAVADDGNQCFFYGRENGILVRIVVIFQRRVYD